MTLSDIADSIDEAMLDTEVSKREAESAARAAVDHINNLLRQDARSRGACYTAIVLGDAGELVVTEMPNGDAAPLLSSD